MEIKNDLQTYYLASEPVVDIERINGRIEIVKWHGQWHETIVLVDNDLVFHTHLGEEWFGIHTVSDLKILIFGKDTFVVSDEMAYAIRNYKGERK